ncbi:MAG TPA: hypothetical protein P5560_12180 [Thermotogota bacterium]|nr:hypothetical protein [Thermotogota bacterium]HRW93699.1 hypothetical protein [Thermotogota bacterium]
MNLDTLQVVFVFNWILFIGLIPLSVYWIRRGWKIWRKKEYSLVALWKGRPPENAKKFAPYAILSNLGAGIIFLVVFLLVLLVGLHYDTWTGIVGITFWMKILTDFNVSMYAHKIGVFSFKRK